MKRIAGIIGICLGLAALAAIVLFGCGKILEVYFDRNPGKSEYEGVWQAYETIVDGKTYPLGEDDGNDDYLLLRSDWKAKIGGKIAGDAFAYEGVWDTTRRDREKGTRAGVVVVWDDGTGVYENPYMFCYLGEETPAINIDQPIASVILSIDYGYRIVHYERILDSVPDEYWNLESSNSAPAESRPSNDSSESAPPKGAISWQDARSHIGESVTIYGPVVDTNYAQTANGRPTYLDLGVAYPDEGGMTVVIWGEDRSKFEDAPESLYEGKTICITGEPYLYNGHCYIEATSPSQIQTL